MKMKSLVAASVFSALYLSTPVLAKHDKGSSDSRVVKGTYTITKGTVETFDVSTDLVKLEQLGQFEIVLKSTDWKSFSKEERKSIKKQEKVKGVLKGTIDLTNFFTAGPVISHVMIDDDRTFSLHSAYDVFIPLQGDLFCSGGEPMIIKEYVNLVGATGVYENLQSGTIVLEGTVNNCPGFADYGKYDFDIVPDESVLIFQ